MCDGATYHLTRHTSAGETRPLDSRNDQTLQKVKASLCGRFSSLVFFNTCRSLNSVPSTVASLSP
jgi:hypothetical protein